jgi:hypothetical protein
MSLCVAKSFDVPGHPYIVHLVEFNCDIISSSGHFVRTQLWLAEVDRMPNLMSPRG